MEEFEYWKEKIESGKAGIVMENLKHILKKTRVSKKQRARHHSWFFRRLQKCIEYKALWEGIPVMYVTPDYSSQICSKCGALNKRNKHIYKCKKCGFECNADYNAGRNLATKPTKDIGVRNTFQGVSLR